ncbi:hypothetical protein SKAU_G00334480 [Synaphobranchus kaupii]|uniref:Uncharacterized protein n=1 Tax=Synaphobranchus kaupii TaxID=118154 RepID=A0A9Q1ELU0_SYNKA|nr:hypothetical protein SKAU_G00334480 [Synaphobranchus kaupii]
MSQRLVLRQKCMACGQMGATKCYSGLSPVSSTLVRVTKDCSVACTARPLSLWPRAWLDLSLGKVWPHVALLSRKVIS